MCVIFAYMHKAYGLRCAQGYEWSLASHGLTCGVTSVRAVATGSCTPSRSSRFISHLLSKARSAGRNRAPSVNHKTTDLTEVIAMKHQSFISIFFYCCLAVLTLYQPATAAGCQGYQPTIYGTPGADTIQGTMADDIIVGLGGGDVIIAGEGNDVVCGGRGNDKIFCGPGYDRCDGGKRSDKLQGGPQSDILRGGRSRDYFYGGDHGANHCPDAKPGEVAINCSTQQDH